MLKTVTICCLLALLRVSIGSNSILTSFKHNFLDSGWETMCREQGSIGQAVYLMKNHFYRRHLYSAKQWDSFRTEAEANSDSEDALLLLMSKFNDRYSAFIPKRSMEQRWLSGKGVRQGSLLTLRRRWRPLRMKWIKRGLSMSIVTPSRALSGVLASGVVAAWRKPLFKSPAREVLGAALAAQAIVGLISTVYPLEIIAVNSSDSVATGKVQVGDKVLAIDGQSTNLMLPGTVASLLLSPNITLSLCREYNASDSQLWTEHLSVGSIDVPSVDSRLLPGSRIGLLTITDFTDRTYSEVSEHLLALQQQVSAQDGQQYLEGLVVDLRQNSGGTLSSALDVAALFVPRGSALLRIDLGTGVQQVQSLNHYPDTATPLLLVCDKGTASSSEVLLHALIDNGRCTTMGQRTFGKSVAQALVPLCDSSGLIFTVAEFFSPLGKSMASGHKPLMRADTSRATFRVDDIHYCKNERAWKVK